MLVRNVKVIITGAEEKHFEGRLSDADREAGKTPPDVVYLSGRVQVDPYEDPVILQLSKVVPDGVYTCALSVTYDFNNKKTRVKCVVGDPCKP